MSNKQSSRQMTLTEALELAEYTLNDDGSLSCDLGDGELVPLWERNVRAEIQTIDMFIGFSEHPHPDSPTVLDVENLNRFKDAYNVILDYILSQPGHVPDTELPDPEWKISVRDYHVTDTGEALEHLNLKQTSQGSYYRVDNAGKEHKVDKDYCLKEIDTLENNRAENDEGIYFWLFHNNRMLTEAYKVIMDNLVEAKK